MENLVHFKIRSLIYKKNFWGSDKLARKEEQLIVDAIGSDAEVREYEKNFLKQCKSFVEALNDRYEKKFHVKKVDRPYFCNSYVTEEHFVCKAQPQIIVIEHDNILPE